MSPGPVAGDAYDAVLDRFEGELLALLENASAPPRTGLQSRVLLMT